ncbi:cytochrome P450, partial [Dacryopinax primogenitus]
PPGPQGLPLIGNLLQVPTRLAFLKFAEWSKVYGPLTSYTTLGQRVVVISSAKAAGDILDRLSAKTSDRPCFIKTEHLTHNMDFATVNQGAFWRTQRRAAHESLNVHAAKSFFPVQEEESCMLVEGLVRHPEIDIARHLYRYVSSIAWRVIYGHSTIKLEVDEPGVPPDSFFRAFFQATIPGGSIVDIFPFLHPVISRSKFLRRVTSGHLAYMYPGRAMNGTLAPVPSSSMHILLRRCVVFLRRTGPFIAYSSHDPIRWRGCRPSARSSRKRTATALKWFFIAMLLHPQAAVTARSQLDLVVGKRFPTFGDIEHLSYVQAIVKETLRWRPPGPAGLAHVATEDIVYDKFLIPKGTILIPNVWSICRDPALYQDGDTFDPSRFLDDRGNLKPSPADSHDDYLVFGHGRRVCVGKNLAVNMLLIAVAQLLWAFDF